MGPASCHQESSIAAPRIPPIQGLLAFDALSRLRSVTLASEELNVTPERNQPPDPPARDPVGHQALQPQRVQSETEGATTSRVCAKRLPPCSKFRANARSTPTRLAGRGDADFFTPAPAAKTGRIPPRLPGVDLVLQVTIPF